MGGGGLGGRSFFTHATEAFAPSVRLEGHFSHTPPKLSRFRGVSAATFHTRHRGFRAFGVYRQPSFTHATEVFAFSGRLGDHLPHTPPRFPRLGCPRKRENLGGVCEKRPPRRPENAKTSVACVKDGRRDVPKQDADPSKSAS